MSTNSQTRVSRTARMCLLVGLLISSIVGIRMYRAESDRIRQEFGSFADANSTALNKQLETSLSSLYAIRAFIDASEQVTRDEYRTFCNFLLSDRPTMRAFGWIPVITRDERLEAEATAWWVLNSPSAKYRAKWYVRETGTTITPSTTSNP